MTQRELEAWRRRTELPGALAVAVAERVQRVIPQHQARALELLTALCQQSLLAGDAVGRVALEVRQWRASVALASRLSVTD